MYTTRIPSIEDKFLHDAVVKCVENGYKFHALYVSEDNLCSVSFVDKLNEKDIKTIFSNFDIDIPNPVYDKHYTYMYDFIIGFENRECTLVLISNGVED